MKAHLILIIFSLLLGYASSDLSKHQEMINVKDFGAIGDGISNDYQAISLAIQRLNKLGKGILFFPKGNYLLDDYIDEFSVKKHLIIENCNDIEIYGDNAIINVKGDFHRKITKKGKHSRSKISAFIPFCFRNCNNISFHNLAVKGNVDKTTRDDKVVEENGHLLQFLNCNYVNIKNVKLSYAQTDGLLISQTTKDATSSEFRIENLISTNNARQALSIGGLVNATFLNCKFENTGITGGQYGRHAPSAGLDIEPGRDFKQVKDITFNNCSFKNNLGSQITISHISTTTNILFENCEIISGENSKRLGVLINAKDIKFNSCLFDLKNSDIYPVWHKDGASCSIKNSTIKSNLSGVVAVNNFNQSNVIIENTQFEYTGNKRIPRFFPYIRMKNLDFINNKIYIPKEFIRGKKFDGLIQNVRLLKNLKTKSEDRLIQPKVSILGSNKINH